MQDSFQTDCIFPVVRLLPFLCKRLASISLVDRKKSQNHTVIKKKKKIVLKKPPLHFCCNTAVLSVNV